MAEERFVFDALVEMCIRLGTPPLNEVDGCWTYQINDSWWVAVNGHKEDCEVVTPQSKSPVKVPPFTAYLDYNGWPAGFIDPYSGTMAAGEKAHEQTFMAACDAVAVA